jgi:hypothetical protein
VTTRLSPEDLALAIELGDGIEALGIRLAVRVAASLGIEKAKELAREIDKQEKQLSKAIAQKRRKATPPEASPLEEPSGGINISQLEPRSEPPIPPIDDIQTQDHLRLRQHGT